MGLIKTGILGLIVLYVISIFLRSSENVVTELPNTWWGPGNEKPNADKSIRPFKVVFDNKVRDLIFHIFYVIRYYYMSRVYVN